MIEKLKKHIKLLVVLSIFIYVGILYLLHKYSEACLFVILLGIMIFCTYMTCGIILGTIPVKRKIVIIEWLLYIAVLNLLMNLDAYTKTGAILFDKIVIIAATITFIVRIFIIYFRSTSIIADIQIIAWFGLMAFVLAVAFMEFNIKIYLFFKFLVLLIIFCGIKMANRANRFVGMLIIIAAYLIMVIMFGALDIKFAYSTMEEAWDNFYLAIQRIYSLPNIDELETTVRIIDVLLSFVIGRIMDAVLIGALVNIFTEKESGWFDKGKDRNSSDNKSNNRNG